MRKKMKLLAVLMMAVMMLTACNGFLGIGEKEEKDPTAVFMFNGKNIYKGEVYIYVNSVKERYELCYGVDVWDKTVTELATTTDAEMLDEPTIEELTRENIINEIVDVKTLYSMKKNKMVKLTDKEEEDLKARANEFYAGLNDADKINYEITADMAYDVLYENAIAGKVRASLLDDESLEISDEEARMTTFYDMCFECYSEDEYGNIKPYTEEEKKRQYENALQACSMLATAEVDNNEKAESIDKLAAYYNLEHSREYTLSPSDVMNIYGPEVTDRIYAMENGNYSTVIESEFGYHVFQMISLTDKKATAANKEIIKKQRYDTLLFDRIESKKKSLDKNFSYPDSINMDVYNTIKIVD